MAAIGKADEELRADLLFTLAKRGDRDAIDTLVIFSASDHDGVRLSALEGLARLAAPEAVEVLLAVAAKSDDPFSRRIFQEELRLADGLAAAGNVKDSRRLYEYALQNAPEARYEAAGVEFAMPYYSTPLFDVIYLGALE